MALSIAAKARWAQHPNEPVIHVMFILYIYGTNNLVEIEKTGFKSTIGLENDSADARGAYCPGREQGNPDIWTVIKSQYKLCAWRLTNG